MNILSCSRTAGAALSLLAALLAGCGPTTGGTGTGDSLVGLTSFGATAVGSCSASFADALDCQTGAGGMPANQLGSAPVVFSGSGAAEPYVLTVQGNQAELVSRCSNARFDGLSGLLPDGVSGFFGSFSEAAGGAAQPAQLDLKRVQGVGDTLQLAVLGVDGHILLGPLQLQRVAVAPSGPARCP